MIRTVTGIFVWLVSAAVLAGNEVGEIRQTIDATVWKTFKDAFESLDGEALNAVYADEVLRVAPDGIDTRGHFKTINQTRFRTNRERGERVALDFWFDSRHTNASVSYDVGFYRLRVTARSGATSDFYGQFHIVLKKLDGRWKIVQDWDTGAVGGRTITARDFDRRPPVEF